MKIRALAIFLSALLLLHGSFVTVAGAAALNISKPRYYAAISIFPKEHRVAGTVTIQFPTTGEQVTYFHLYPNAFIQGANRVGPSSAWTEEVGEQTMPGTYAVQQVLVQGKKVPFTIKDTILQVPIVTKRDQPIEVQITFDCVLPVNQGRFTYDEHALWLGNWLPILAVKQDAGWRLDPYYPIGDPFFSQTADYTVKLTVPEEYQIASSGVDHLSMVTTLSKSKQKQYTLNAANVRDFALVVMDQSYVKSSAKVGTTVVQTWWRTGDNVQQVTQLHNTAVQSLAYYNQQFGTYPYAEYDVVQTGGTFGGMEYPGLVFVQGEYFQKLNDIAMSVVAHETAHQWFYGMVGSDEVNEPWLDEGLTEYASLAFLQQYNPELAKRKWTRLNIFGNLMASSLLSTKLSARQSLQRYPDWQTYSTLAYARPAMMYWQLRDAWGEENLHKVLRKYVQEYQFGIASEKQLSALFSQAVESDAKSFFDYWVGLDGTKAEEARNWLDKGQNMR